MLLLLKVVHDNNVSYYKFKDKEIISLKEETRTGIEVVGDIEFKWHNNK